MVELERGAVTPEVARRLVDSQFPEWSSLPVTEVDLSGWDNRTFRLGESLSVRIPSMAMYEAQVDKEHRWLPALARELPLAIPCPVALGQPDPSLGVSRAWSVYGWLPGRPATVDAVRDWASFAADVGGFLRALYTIDVSDGPAWGAHSFGRGGPVGQWNEATVTAIEQLSDVIDDAAAHRVWAQALRADEVAAPVVWVHGDITGSNLLVDDEGRLCAVLDFGCSAVGDPACDLVMTWTGFVGDDRRRFVEALPSFDDATWARARGWALWRALMQQVHARRSGADPAATRLTWRTDSLSVLHELLSDA